MRDGRSDSEYGRSVSFSSMALVCGIYAAIYLFFASAGASDIQRIITGFGIKIDLTLCSIDFSRLIATQAIFMFATAALSALGCLSSTFNIYTHKRAFAPYSKQMMIMAGLGAFALLPWLNGDVFMAKRFALVDACLASHKAIPVKVHLAVVLGGVHCWIILLLIMGTNRLISAGRDPRELSEDSKIREAQLRARQMLEARRSVGKMGLKLVPLFLAGAICLPVTVWLAISTLRAYHNVVWEKADARLVAVGGRCTIESREDGKKWETAVKTPCVTGDSARPSTLHRKTRDKGGKEWRMKQMPTVVLAVKKPDGTEELISARRDVFMPVPVPMGTKITILRDPNSAQRLDRVFGSRDWIQFLARLLVVTLFGAGTYFFYLRKPLKAWLPELSGRRRELLFGRRK